jgi:hypothetical protein
VWRLTRRDAPTFVNLERSVDIVADIVSLNEPLSMLWAHSQPETGRTTHAHR